LPEWPDKCVTAEEWRWSGHPRLEINPIKVFGFLGMRFIDQLWLLGFPNFLNFTSSFDF
jgi:hypothetical protein